MGNKDIFKLFERKIKEQLSFLDNLSDEKKKEIIENEKAISEEIKLMLDNANIKISDIHTSFRKDFKTKDGDIVDVFYTVFTPVESERTISIISDSKREKQYVRISVNKFLSIQEFFEKNNSTDL